MTKEQLAEQLDGCEIGEEVSKKLGSLAKENGLVVIFGASDDLMEFRGAIDDECGAYDGTIALIDSEGLLPEREQIEDDEILERFFIRRKTAKNVEALWCKEANYSWTFETDIPHASFDVMEEKEKYCRGIVIEIPKGK